MDRDASALQHLAKLVEIPSTPGNGNGEMADYVTSVLAPHGFAVQRIRSPLDDCDGLIASIGPPVSGGIVLSGHMDVVSVTDQVWTTPPFAATERNNRVHGRGTTDMKGFLAACLSVASTMNASDLKRPLHFFFSGDEETNCRSIDSLLAYAATSLPDIAGVVIGEPTGMHPIDRHKGSWSYRVEIEGRARHSSMMHEGVCAIALAARLITWLEERTDRNAGKSGPGDFTPNYSTMHAGTIEGGIASNTVAAACRFQWDLRVMPDEDASQYSLEFEAHAAGLEEKARRIAPEATIRNVCEAEFPGLKSEPETPFHRACHRLLGTSSCSTAPFGTEAGHFQRAGHPVLVIGPGSVDQAHIADEFIAIEELDKCVTFLNGLIEVQCADA